MFKFELSGGTKELTLYFICFNLFLSECRLATWRMCRMMLLRGSSPGTSGGTWIVSSPKRQKRHGGSIATHKAGSRSWPWTVCLWHQATGTTSASVSVFLKIKPDVFCDCKNFILTFSLLQLPRNTSFILYLQAPWFISVLLLASEYLSWWDSCVFLIIVF